MMIIWYFLLLQIYDIQVFPGLTTPKVDEN